MTPMLQTSTLGVIFLFYLLLIEKHSGGRYQHVPPLFYYSKIESFYVTMLKPKSVILTLPL